MSDAAHLAREAKGLHQGLKELLKTHPPWDKEVEFGRKSLRRQHLRLLLAEPYAKESKDAETHLWMQTSYQFISHYKQSLAALDRTLQSLPRAQQRQAGHGPVEYRKLIQRFRQFLSDEDKFWTQFVVRYQRAFALHEAYPVLVALAILSPASTDDDANLPTLPDSGTTTTTTTTTTSGGRNSASQQSHHGRSHPFFPPEDSAPAPDPAEHASRLAIFSKALVCLGDIARYRELYNESGGRPKAGHEDGTVPAKRGGRGGRGSASRGGGGIPGFEAIPRARNYDRAIACYEQARMLVPYEGNPSHQLAILAFYQGDMFGSLLHYYRALCVRQPYETAAENVKKILSRALDQQAKKLKDAHPTSATTREPGQVPPPRLRVDHLKENVVLLHALWRLGPGKLKTDPVAHADEVANDFQSLVSERVLPIELVSKVVVLSQGALWNHRMIRDAAASLPPLSDSSSNDNRRSARRRLPELPSSGIESQILGHIIAIYRGLLEIGAAELAVPPPEDAAENDLAQRITAPFRRTLPALRIASKWLVANIHYVLHAAALPVNDGGYRHGSTGKGTRETIMIEREEWSLFWAKFVRFYSALGAVFPSERLPPLATPLDEDVDLKGFLPLRDLLLVDGGVSPDVVPEGRRGHQRQNGNPSSHAREKVHPNEEQLMRIWDLLQDAKYFAELEACPIRLDSGNVFSFVDDGAVSSIASSLADVRREPVRIQDADQINQNGVRQIEDDDDAMTEDTTRTDDDPVRDAFERVLDDHGAMDDEGDEEAVEAVGEEDEEGDEVILYNPRPLGSPPTPGVPLATLPATPRLRSAVRGVEDDYHHASSVPMGATNLMSSPGRTGAPSSKSSLIVPGTTAQDLLNNVMGTKRGGMNGHAVDVARPPPARPAMASASTLAPQFPFGLGPSAPPSIWSTSLDRESPSSPNINIGSTTFGSPSLHGQRHGWSSSQGGSSALGLGSPHSVAAASGLVGGHVSSFGTPQQQLGRQSTLASQWRVNSNRVVSHVEPAVVSGTAMSPPGRPSSTAHLGNMSASSSSYQQHSHHAATMQHGAFWSAGSAGLHHQKSPSASRIWGGGIHG